MGIKKSVAAPGISRGRESAQRTCANRSGRAVVVPVVGGLALGRPLGVIVVGHCFRRRGRESIDRARTDEQAMGWLSKGLQDSEEVSVAKMRGKIQKLRSNAICGAMDSRKTSSYQDPHGPEIGTARRLGCR